MRGVWNIVKSGIDSARAHPERHVATWLCLTFVLVPYLTGLCAIRSRRSVESCEWRVAADLIVEGRRAGRRCLVPVAAGAPLSELPGVERVTPQLAFAAWSPELAATLLLLAAWGGGGVLLWGGARVARGNFERIYGAQEE